jgi:predicted outer membrane repeat protein
MERFYPYNDVHGDVVGKMDGGAIFLEGASLNVCGRVNFKNNEAKKGGAIYADRNSSIIFENSGIKFISNRANLLEEGFARGNQQLILVVQK